MKRAYVNKRFDASTMGKIVIANKIIEEYQAQGFELTLRQLYYQFVARGIIPNTMREYKKLGDAINNARLAGLVDWTAIVDRTRNLQGNNHWDSPAQVVRACVEQYRIDTWANQEYRVEVWIEKDALIGIAETVCRELDVSYFSCRGYTSQSEMWAAGQRFYQYAHRHNQTPVIIHLGDHDPSGLDMSRDIADRLAMFMGGMEVKRVALNMDQIKRYNPPPNPAKTTDARAKLYIRQYGHESWELDALDPKVLTQLIEREVLKLRDDDVHEDALKLQEKHRRQLVTVASQMEKGKLNE